MRKNVLLAIAIVTMSMIACQDSSPRIEAPILEKALLDMYLAEVKARMVDSNKVLGNESNKDELALYYSSILKNYNITIEDFRSTMKWYTEHPLKLDTMYQRILDTLSVRNQTKRDTAQSRNIPIDNRNIPNQNSTR